MTLLTDKQREEVVEAMARAVFLRRNGMATCWSWDEGGLDDEHPGAREQYLKDATAALTAALPAIERAVLDKLSDPVFVRLNILSGGIARPDDLVWLHDTDGPVAAKVREVARAALEKAAGAARAQADVLGRIMAAGHRGNPHMSGDDRNFMHGAARRRHDDQSLAAVEHIARAIRALAGEVG